MLAFRSNCSILGNSCLQILLQTMSQAFYFDQIELFPPELQNSSAVLYAIVKSISRLHCNTLTLADKRCDSDQPSVSEEKKSRRGHVGGEGNKFPSPNTQPNESISNWRCSSILEHFDHIGRRSAKSALIAGDSKGANR